MGEPVLIIDGGEHGTSLSVRPSEREGYFTLTAFSKDFPEEDAILAITDTGDALTRGLARAIRVINQEERRIRSKHKPAAKEVEVVKPL